MSLKNIGNVISELRKNKGVKQEELATAVGVSTQAVSKWENGGTPDTELLPLIADYFSVSIDRLFGRNIGDYSDINTGINKYIEALSDDNKIMEAYKLCAAIFHDKNSFKLWDKPCHSGLTLATGFIKMSLSKELPYGFILPKPENGWLNALSEMSEYQKLFELLSDIDMLNALVFLNSREDKPFTPELLVKKLSIPIEKAESILDKLEERKWLYKQEIELDDEIKTVSSYRFQKIFLALLIFAKELITPVTFSYSSSTRGSLSLI